jgi:phosphate transport system substrate-binding protein
MDCIDSWWNMCAREVVIRLAAGAAVVLAVVLGPACTREPGSTALTKGALVVVVDEAIEPVMRREVEDFQAQYPQAAIEIRVMEAREAVAAFAADSVRVIAIARRLNEDERNALTGAKIWFEEHHVAQSAVAVIVHPSNPRKEIRIGELDSIFTGTRTTWSSRGSGGVIEAVIGGLNSSTNEAFRDSILDGRAFGLAATPVPRSADIVATVARTPNAIGLAPLNWLQGAGDVSVMAVGGPGFRPDSSLPAGKYFSPAQAYVYLNYYPLTTPVYVYTREVTRDLSLGFIAFISSPPGQKLFQEAGLVPKTMPVRLIQLSSK